MRFPPLCHVGSDTNSGHQEQTRSVPLDWVFVVPPGALVAVRALKMKDHHLAILHHNLRFLLHFVSSKSPMFSNIDKDVKVLLSNLFAKEGLDCKTSSPPFGIFRSHIFFRNPYDFLELFDFGVFQILTVELKRAE